VRCTVGGIEQPRRARGRTGRLRLALPHLVHLAQQAAGEKPSASGPSRSVIRPTPQEGRIEERAAPRLALLEALGIYHIGGSQAADQALYLRETFEKRDTLPCPRVEDQRDCHQHGILLVEGTRSAERHSESFRRLLGERLSEPLLQIGPKVLQGESPWERVIFQAVDHRPRGAIDDETSQPDAVHGSLRRFLVGPARLCLLLAEEEPEAAFGLVLDLLLSAGVIGDCLSLVPWSVSAVVRVMYHNPWARCVGTIVARCDVGHAGDALVAEYERGHVLS
jgi:hypothetical protein